MLHSAAEAEAHLESGASLLGPGWREIESFEDLSDEDEYTTDEEEIYAILDFGQALDRQQLQTESTFQMIVYQGELAPLIGDEVILGMVRDPANPAQPSHPPLHTSSHHMIFRPITLHSKEDTSVPRQTDGLEAPPKKLGRPKGSTTKPRVIVQSEAEVSELAMGSLPDDIVIEIVQPQIPGGEHVPNKRLTKHQAERLMAGLPPTNRRVQDPITGIKVPRKRGPRKTAQSTIPDEELRLPDGDDNAEAGPSTGRTGGGRASKKGKGKAKERTAAESERPEDLNDQRSGTESVDEGAGLPVGGVYLATKGPMVKRPKGRPRKDKGAAPFVVAGVGSADGGPRGGGMAAAGSSAANRTGAQATGSAGAEEVGGGGSGAGDAEMEDDGGAEGAPSPLMEMDDS